jgi:hypothetical protein
LEVRRKKFGPIFKELQNFLPKNLSLSSQNICVWDPGFEIRDPRSGIWKKPIQDPRVKKAPDPGSATLVRNRNLVLNISIILMK